MDININKLFHQINDFEEEKIEIKEEEETLQCINCKTNTLVFFDGGTFCNKCGQLQDVRFNHEQEYRYYGDSDSKSDNDRFNGMIDSDNIQLDIEEL